MAFTQLFPFLQPRVLVWVLIAFTISCANTQKSIYFNNTPDSEIESVVESLEPVIQRNDLLSITVYSLNPDANKSFNLLNTARAESTTAAGNNTVANGYLVSQEGIIQFPQIGRIKAAGLTKKQLIETIETELVKKKLLLEPIVLVRYLNYKVTVLGEVKNPTVINVPDEKITLLEALGLAGDITVYGKRDNIMVIREIQGKKRIKRLNLNSSEIFSSPYYYLKSNDVVYVEMNKRKLASVDRTNQWLPLLVSGLYVVAIVVDRIIR